MHDGKKRYNIWWGPPKKFSTQFEDRRISWLELFYDLVYVLVISRVTHRLTEDHSITGILDYGYLFAMTFWGWYNGSQHHDLHGTPGIRTRFLTLWQMMAAGALAVTLDSPPEHLVGRTTVALLFLQFYITYIWWSVGIYDKHHRKLNRPYTVLFLVAFALLCLTFFIPQPWKRVVFWLSLFINYLPFFLTAYRLRSTSDDFSMSASMTERLGLFTIIVFGEAILGVINSMQVLKEVNTYAWICFAFGILIVFALWWVFFACIADRECKKGMLNAVTIAALYIPTLASLGMTGAAFPSLLQHTAGADSLERMQLIYGLSIAVFLWSTVAISRILVHPPEYGKAKGSVQLLLILAGLVNVLLVFVLPYMAALTYLLIVFCILLFIVVILTRSWFRIELDKQSS
jgi:low temperature requirement protein LtrA